MATNALNVLAGPKRSADTLMKRVQRWVKAGLIPAPADWEAERRTLAAAVILFELYDHAGVRSRDMLGQIFDRLTAGEAPLVDALLSDAVDGSPVLVLTHWLSIDGRAATSFVFRLTADLDEPIVAPGDEWEPTLEGVLSLAPVLDKLIDAAVVPFPRKATH